MNVVVIKYNAGNVRSVQIALERMGIIPEVTDNHEKIVKADRVIFPGVGEASSAMRYIKERSLDKIILSIQQPFLGICLGMQLMCTHSEENDTPCLGIFSQHVLRFNATNQGEKIPQIGWNSISELRSPLFNGITDDSFCYFVHSYRADIGSETIAVTNYCGRYSAALAKGNFYGVQFHPEKSASIGEVILKNFINLPD